MTLNLDKHKDELVSGWKEVVDFKSPTNWALFSYMGQSYDLNLVGKGDGGLEELENELNSGRIMYALCRVYVPEKNAEKIVLINWQGEGAPLAFKGTCANHVSTIKSFFKGVQISINARTEEDVEPSFVISTVAKAIAGEGIKSSSIDCESDGKIGPVGTAYKRINPLDEINTQAKDDFWRKQQEEELYRKKEEQTKLRKFSQNDVMALRQESQEYFNTDEKEQKEQQNHNHGHGKDHHSPNVNNTPPTTNTKQMNGNGNVSPVSPQVVNMSSRDARLATTPKKNLSNESSNLVRQRIKSFDGSGASIPMPKSPLNPSTSNNFTNINRNIRITPTTTPVSSNFGKSNGLTPPHGSDSRSKSPLSPSNGVVNRSSSPCSTASTASNAESHDHDESDSGLSVLKRRQMFENGGFQSSSNNYVRQNPQEEIKKEREKNKIVPNPVFTATPATTTTTTSIKKEDPVTVTSPPPPKATNYSYSNSNTTTNSSSNNKAQITSPTATTAPDIKKSLSPKNEIIPQKSPVFEEDNKSPSPIAAAPAKTGNGYHGYNYINNIGQHQLQDTYELEDGEILDDTLNDTFDEHDNDENEFVSGHQAGMAAEDNNFNDIAQSPELVGMEDRIIPGGSLKRFEITEEMGLCARALYDYQAEDDTEISFDPSDIITNIEKIDDGWWQGKNSSDMFGLFPSNYVELLN